MPSERPRRKPLRTRLWERVRRFFGRSPPPEPPRHWGDDEPALVPAGRPRRPRPAAAVELELPQEPEDTDAYGAR